jgi:hypothetical protein
MANYKGTPPTSSKASLVFQLIAIILTVIANLSFGFAYAPGHIYAPHHLLMWLILLGLYALLSRAAYRGSNAARISLTVFILAYVLVRAHSIYGSYMAPWLLIEAVLLAVMALSVILLYLPSSNRWFMGPSAVALRDS